MVDLVEAASAESFLKAAFFSLSLRNLCFLMILAAWVAVRPMSYTETAGFLWESFLILAIPCLDLCFKVMVKVLLKFLSVLSFLTEIPMVLAAWEAQCLPLLEKTSVVQALPMNLVLLQFQRLVRPQITSGDLSVIVLLPTKQAKTTQ